MLVCELSYFFQDIVSMLVYASVVWCTVWTVRIAAEVCLIICLTDSDIIGAVVWEIYIGMITCTVWTVRVVAYIELWVVLMDAYVVVMVMMVIMMFVCKRCWYDICTWNHHHSYRYSYSCYKANSKFLFHYKLLILGYIKGLRVHFTFDWNIR